MLNIILVPELNRSVRPDGTIEIEYTNGSIYVGQLNAQNEFHGIGKYINNFGNYYIGAFNNGKKHGPCVEKWWGIAFEGNYVDNNRNGMGMETYRDGEYSVGNYVSNKRRGVFAFTKPDVSTLTRTYDYAGELIVDNNRYIMPLPSTNITMM